MKAVVLLGNSRVEVADLPIPQVKPGWVLVKTMAGGMCGSDLHFYHSTPEELGSRVGMAVGHEPAGIVAEVGTGVTGVRAGDRVSVYHWVSCGHCHYCRSGLFQFCRQRLGIAASGNGSSAEYVLAPAANCLPLPEELSFETGAMMACCAGTAYSALSKLDLNGDDTLVVFGQGPVGLCVTAEATALGARVIAVEIKPERIALAQEMGAAVAIDATRADPVEVIRDLTRGRGTMAAIETSGSSAGRRQALRCLDQQGTAVYVGLGSRADLIDPEDLIDAELTIRGSYVMPLSLYRPLAEFLVEKQVDLDRIVTQRYPLEQGVEAFELFASQTTGKPMFIPEHTS